MELDLAFVDQTLDRVGRNPDRILPVLQLLQRHYRYLPGEALRRVAEQSDITLAQIASVSTFYSQFRHRPVGRNLISVCNGTACHVKGAERVYDVLRDYFQITGNDDTDASGEYTVEKVFCIGCCTLAPVVRCGDDVYGPQTTDGIPQLIRRIQAHQGNGQPLIAPGLVHDGQSQGEVKICLDSCCLARGCDRTFRSMEQALRETGVPVRIKRVACGLMCEQAPMIEIEVPGAPRKSTRTSPGRPPRPSSRGIFARGGSPRGCEAS